MEVYEAAANPEYFHEVGNRISEFTQGGRAHFLLFDPVLGREYLSELSGERDDFSKEYNETYLPLDFRVPRVLALPTARFTDERAYVAPEEARTSDIHQDLLARYGVHNIYGANMRSGQAVGWFGLSVRTRGGEFDGRATRTLSGLVLHIHRAYETLRANRDLLLDRRLMASALDDAKSAILISDGGRVVVANTMMQEFLSRDFFRLQGGRLGCRDREEARKLAAVQTGEVTFPNMPIVIRDRRAAESFAVKARQPFPQVDRDGMISSRQTIVTITPIVKQGATAPQSVHAFCREHGLTDRESGAVAAILTGKTLDVIARERGVTVDTIRKQLKSAMGRLEVGSQKAMIVLFERFQMAE